MSLLLIVLFIPFTLGYSLETELTVGSQIREITTTGSPYTSSLFEKFGEVPKGGFIEKAYLKQSFNFADLSLKGDKILRNNSSYGVQIQRWGKLGLSASWDNTPYLFTNEAKSLYQFNGVDYLAMQVSTPTRAWAVYSSTSFATLIEGAEALPLASKTNLTNMDLKYLFSRGGGLFVGASRRKRAGSQISSIGFTSAATEIALPLNDFTDEAYAELQGSTEFLTVSLRYDMSSYNNTISKLTVDNPRSVTLGALSRPLDNLLQKTQADAVVMIAPLHMTIGAQAASSRLTQDVTLMPYSPNASVLAAPFDVTNSSNLPRLNLENRMGVLSQVYRIDFWPVQEMNFFARFTSYELKDQRPSVSFPGRVIYDSYWLAGTMNNFSEGYKNSDFAAGLEMRPFQAFSMRFESGKKIQERDFREIPKTNEAVYLGHISVSPNPRVQISLSHLISYKRAKGFLNSVLNANSGYNNETVGLRRFDVADRDKGETKAAVSWRLSGWEFGLSGHLTQDKYPASKQYPYGLLSLQREAFGFDTSIPLIKDWTIEGNLMFETTDLKSRSFNTDPGSGDWSLQEKNSFITGDTSLNLSFIPDVWINTLGYAKQIDTGLYEYFDLGSSVSDSSNLPKLESRSEEFYVRSEIRPTKFFRVRLGFARTRVTLFDFAKSDIPLIAGEPFPVATYVGASLRPYKVSLSHILVSLLW